MKSSFRKTAALLAALIMLLSFTGCAAAYATAATDLMKGVTASKQTEDPQALIKGGAKAADFAVRLFKASYEMVCQQAEGIGKRGPDHFRVRG